MWLGEFQSKTLTVIGGVACVLEGTDQETELGLQDGHGENETLKGMEARVWQSEYGPGLDFQFSWKMLFEWDERWQQATFVWTMIAFGRPRKHWLHFSRCVKKKETSDPENNDKVRGKRSNKNASLACGTEGKGTAFQRLIKPLHMNNSMGPSWEKNTQGGKTLKASPKLLNKRSGRMIHYSGPEPFRSCGKQDLREHQAGAEAMLQLSSLLRLTLLRPKQRCEWQRSLLGEQGSRLRQFWGAEAVAAASGAQDGKRIILSERRQSQKQELEAEMEFEEGVASFLSSFFHFFFFFPISLCFMLIGK